jgi:hypothetical protein
MTLTFWSGQYFLLSVLDGAWWCAVRDRLPWITTSFHHSKGYVTFHSIFGRALGPAIYGAEQAGVRIITRLVAWSEGRLRCAIGHKHWWLQVLVVADSSWSLLYRVRCPKDVTAATAWRLQHPATCKTLKDNLREHVHHPVIELYLFNTHTLPISCILQMVLFNHAN